ncbi:response regulator FixJ [Dongia sedimenti]|uniref:Response regulator FixJ n=1 Tax=Dongia sedimenti TaxID=3064282 RepID=A0ABU0YJG3_9PROT|nr:response regulator FixJ [Rhodospirillaceae bacterium R-7]
MADEMVFVVDDDADVRDSLCALLESAGVASESYDSARAFLDVYQPQRSGCLIADIRMPDMDGLELQEELNRRNAALPVIVVTGHADVPLAVRAMKAGAVDLIEKPYDDALLLASVRRALAKAQSVREQAATAEAAKARIANLSARERQVLELLVAGQPNKIIAYELDISPRTVEIHRAHVMEKMEAKSLSDLVRAAIAAGIPGASK